MSIGFCICIDGTRRELQLLGTADAQRLVGVAIQQDVSAVLLGRLHYQKNRGVAFGGSDTKLSDASAAIIAAGYKQSGISFLQQLEGTFATAVVDLQCKRVLARRDLIGGFPLYYAAHGQRVALGTSLSAVAAWMGIATIDVDYRAQFLVQDGCSHHELPSNRTIYEGIQRLGPCDMLELNLETFEFCTTTFWNWLSDLEPLGTENIEDIAAQYRELLSQAVAERMSGHCAAHVSGGLDSTSVAYLALQDMRSSSGHGKLGAISLVYSSMSVLAQEREVIRESLSHPLLSPHVIEGDKLLDYETLLSPPCHDEPWPWLGMAQTEIARAHVAQSIGADSVLTGQGGDDLLDLGPYYLQDFLRRGRFLESWQHARASAAAENCGTWSILHPFGIAPLCANSRWNKFHAKLTGGQTEWAHMNEYSLPPWIKADFARRFSMQDRLIEQNTPTTDRTISTPLRIALQRISDRTGDLGRQYITAPKGILVEHPFFDPRVVRFLLSHYAFSTPVPRTVPKPILVEAMRGILPDSIRLRQKGGFFNEPHFRGAAVHRKRIEMLIRDADVSQEEWLDKDMLVKCFQQLSMGIGNSRTQVDRLNVTLAWLCWAQSKNEQSPAPAQVFAVHFLSV